MKKLFLLFALVALSATTFAQSAEVVEESSNDAVSPDETEFAILEDGVISTVKYSDVAKSQKRSVSSGCYYNKPLGMMYLHFTGVGNFSPISHNTVCYAPLYQDLKYVNRSKRPLATHWNIKETVGTEGTNVESDVDGNYVQNLKAGELATIPYLYDTDGSYYNMAYNENFGNSSGKYMHYVIGSGYSGDVGWMGWSEIMNVNMWRSEGLSDEIYLMGSGNYTTNFNVTDKDGNKKTIYATFPCSGIVENFYAPASPLYVEGIGFNGLTDTTDLTYQPLENGAVLTMNIYDQATDELMEVLTATTGDWIARSNSYGFVDGFLDFSKVENGMAVPFVIDRAVRIEIIGFDNENVHVGSYGLYTDTDVIVDDGFGEASLMFTDPTGEYKIDNITNDDTRFASYPYMALSIMGMMDKVCATEGYNNLEISADGTTCSNITIGEENNIGGALVRTAWTFGNARGLNYEPEEELPSWITSLDYVEYGDEKLQYLISFTAEPNTSADSRSVTIHLQGRGYTDPTPITITQLGGYSTTFEEANDENVDIYYNILDLEELTCEVLYKLDGYYSGDVNIPEKVVHNGKTYTVVGIGDNAFYNCTDLTSVTIPNTVTRIGDEAFFNCARIKEVVIPDGVTEIGTRTFYYCTALQSITLGAATESIGEGAFYNCYNLTEIAFPETLTSLGEWAFAYCTSVTSIVIPDNVTSLGDYVFYDCTSAKSIVVGSGVTIIPDYGFDYCMSLTDLTLKGDVTYIGYYAFYGAIFTSLTLPESLITIGYGAFEWCPNLTEVTIPSNVTEIAGEAFCWCYALKTVNFNEKLETIGQWAFWECYALTNITFPESLTSIGNGAFRYCYAIDNVDVPDGVTLVDDYAFDTCSALETVTIGEGCTALGIQAFCWDYAIKNVTLGSNVASLGDYAFYSSEVLESITSYNPEPPVCGLQVFLNVPKETCVVYVPAGSKEAYSTADQWQEFFNIVEMEATGINSINPDENEIVGYYTVGGQKVNAPQKGVNIVRYADGTTKKVLVK